MKFSFDKKPMNNRNNEGYNFDAIINKKKVN